MRNHPLGFNLYGLDKAKDRIRETGIAMVFESEKSVLQCINYLGTKSNIAVSMCGSTLSNYQFQLLRDAGAEKICIGIDKDYHVIYDEDYFRILQKIDKIVYFFLCHTTFSYSKMIKNVSKKGDR